MHPLNTENRDISFLSERKVNKRNPPELMQSYDGGTPPAWERLARPRYISPKLAVVRSVNEELNN